MFGKGEKENFHSYECSHPDCGESQSYLNKLGLFFPVELSKSHTGMYVKTQNLSMLLLICSHFNNI